MNARGTYGASRRRGIHVGQGSLFGHTPGDTEDELDQLHGEIMQFGQEVIGWSKQIEEKIKSDPAYKRLADEAKEVYSSADRLPANALKERAAAFKRWHTLQDAAADDFNRRKLGFSVWDKTTWQPFLNGWMKWHSEKKDIAGQMLPGSGTWDRIQEYRKKFIDTRNGAPFKPTGPAPMDPADRKDPSITSGLGDIYKLAKYGLIGVLAVGGLVGISSVVSHTRKGSDPVERYAELYRKRGKGRG